MRRVGNDESGAISVMVAMVIMALLAATALAVDVGRVGYTSRDQQGATDRAVLDAIQVVTAGEATTLQVLHDQVAAAVEQSMDRNPGTSTGTARDRTITRTTLGKMDGTTFTAICDDDPETPAPTCDSATGWTVEDVTAVRADTSSIVDFIFALGDEDGGRVVNKAAVASTEQVAAISVGSRLAELDLNDSNVGDVVDDVLGEMLVPAGVTSYPTLTAVGYDGLVSTTVPLGDVASLDARLLSPRSVVPSVEVGLADLLDVMASAFTDPDDPSATFLADLADGVATADADAGAPFTVDIGQLLWVTTEDDDLAADAQVNLWDLLIGSLQVANLDHGLTLDLSDGTGGVLGMEDLYGINLTATVVEAPRMAIGSVRRVSQDLDGDGTEEDWWATEARNAQVDLDLALTTGDQPSEMESVLGEELTDWLGDVIDDLLCLLSLGLTCNDTEQLGISIEAAEARAGLAGVTCEDGATVSAVETDVLTSALATRIYHDEDEDGVEDGGEDGGDLLEGLQVGLTDPPERVVVSPVPGSEKVADGTLLDVPMLERLLEPALAMLGADLGTAEVRAHWVDCDSRRLAYIE